MGIRHEVNDAEKSSTVGERLTSSESPSPGPPSFQSTPGRKYHFFQNVKVNDDGIALVTFDNPTKPVNTISFALKDEAKALWRDDIEGNSTKVRAVVFSSAKKGGFIAGADIHDIQSTKSDDMSVLREMIKDGMDFFSHMKSLGVPLVCAIDGPALGGGLEWALWCDYRICTDSSKTKLGLPEVKLGLLPGFGGTQNLTALVGAQNALDMMLTGKDIRPRKAKSMGLVDLVVAPQSLEKVAVDVAKQLADGTLQKSKPKANSWMNWIIENTAPGNYAMWNTVQKKVQSNTNGNYPAPVAIMECVKNGMASNSFNEYEFEREQFIKLAQTAESEALIGIFDGMTKMKKHNFTPDLEDPTASVPVKRVAVMGAGLMGAGIAQVTADKGKYEAVLLKDRDDAAVARGESYINGNWDKKVKKKHMTNYEQNINTSRLTYLTDESPSWKKHFSSADMVIEAVFEDLALKRDIVKTVESVTPDHCVFATNTSAIPIADIAVGARRPQNIIGMHYFSPVPSMPLLEIIPHDGTSEATKMKAFEVGTKQGKTCIVVKDVPGFYVNRCLGPYMVEVSALVGDGVDLETLDKAMVNFGMPMGPITLADEVGIDVTSHVFKFLSNADLGVRMTGGDISLMENMVKRGWLGRKSNQGFYAYDGKKKTINAEVKKYVAEFATQKLSLSEQDIQDRILTRFVNEAAKCLEDEIIGGPVQGDIGMVFGTGFAPFRGGPFRYLDTVGVGKHVDLMNRLADTYGSQFEPCQLLQDYAVTGKKFHS